MFPYFTIHIQQIYLPQTDVRHIKFAVEKDPHPEMIVTQSGNFHSLTESDDPLQHPNSEPPI